jgi:CubicO group peptidase (beta-lactamase class C family)
MRSFHACIVLLLAGCAAASPSPVRARSAASRAPSGAASPREQPPRAPDAARPRPLDAAGTRALAAFIEEARARLEVPGASVAVVVGGEVVYERGFGVRALGSSEPVTPDTLFLLGSVTKSMTTMMQATLVDAGRFGWDTPVTRVLPGFALGDAALTGELVMWQMSCACSGMPQQDLETLFEFGSVSPEQRLASMRTMKPTARPGEKYQYSNLMVTAGGYAAAHAFDPGRSLGDAYDAAMRANVFEPIGMRSTTFDFDVVAAADHAMPHAADIDGVTHTLPLAVEHMVVPIRPAGGAWSSARDMARYVITEMTGGVSPDGRRVVSEANLLERSKPRIVADDGDHYGLGLSIGRYRELPVIEHAGGTFGFRTKMYMLPEQGVAVVILTNTTAVGGDFTGVVLGKVLEALFEGAADGDTARARLEQHVEARRERIAQTLATLTRDPDPAWVRGFAGEYRNAGLGTVQILAEAGRGTIDAGEWRSAFAQKTESDGTVKRVKIVLVDPPLAGGEITVRGDATQPRLEVEYAGQTYVFERVGR